MDHRINMRQPLPLAPLFPGLNLTYALKLLQSQHQELKSKLMFVCYNDILNVHTITTLKTKE